MKNTLKAILATTTLVLGSAAHGQLIQTETFSFTPSGNAVLTFNQVDLETSDVVSINVTVEIFTENGTLEGDNDSADVSGSYTATFGVTASLSHSGGGFALFTGTDFIGGSLNATDSQSGTLDVDDGDGVGFDVGGDDYFFFAIDPLSDSDTGAVAPIGYSSYLGLGTYTITITANQFQSITGVGGVATATTPVSLTGSVTVEIVPEPSSFALLAALCTLTFVVTRRKRA